MTRKFVAIVAGIGTAFVLVALIEALGNRAYPMPAGLDQLPGVRG